MRVDEGGIDHAEVAQEAQHYLLRDDRRRRFPMLAAFDEERVARVAGIVELRIVAQTPAGLVAGVDDHVLRHPERERQVASLALPPGKRKRRTRVGHRMQIEQEVGGVVARTQLARTRKLP